MKWLNIDTKRGTCAKLYFIFAALFPRRPSSAFSNDSASFPNWEVGCCIPDLGPAPSTCLPACPWALPAPVPHCANPPRTRTRHSAAKESLQFTKALAEKRAGSLSLGTASGDHHCPSNLCLWSAGGGGLSWEGLRARVNLACRAGTEAAPGARLVCKISPNPNSNNAHNENKMGQMDPALT